MDISKSPSGEIINHTKGYKAYIPNKLPPNLKWNNNVLNSLSRAGYVLQLIASFEL